MIGDAAPAQEAQFVCDRLGFLHDPMYRKAVTAMAGEADTEPLEALAALRLASKYVHDAMERWTESHGLSESRLRLLLMLYHAPERRRGLGELADILSVVPRTITDLIDVLERDGLIRRVPDPADRRSIHAELTEAGVGRVKALKQDAFAQQASAFAGFSREQLRQLRHLCLLLAQQFESKQKAVNWRRS